MSKASRPIQTSATTEPGNDVCFVICAIGRAGSSTRDRADKIRRHVIEPAAEARGYRAVRSDGENVPGQITVAIIRHLIQDPIVVADLSERNPNVYYELAVRDSFGKPAVLIMEEGEEPPFDVIPQRMISVNYRDVDSIDECRSALEAQIEAATREQARVTNPVSIATTMMASLAIKDPSAALAGAVMQKLGAMEAQLTAASRALQSSHVAPSRLVSLDDLLSPGEPVQITPEDIAVYRRRRQLRLRPYDPDQSGPRADQPEDPEEGDRQVLEAE